MTGILDERQGQLQALVVELRSTLEAGGRRPTRSARPSRPWTRCWPDSTAPHPPLPGCFPTHGRDGVHGDVARTGQTAQQLQVLLDQADTKMPALNQASELATGQIASLVDHLYWRLVHLVLVLRRGRLVGALAYRAIMRRST